MVDGFDQARVQLVVSRRVVIGCNWWWLRRRTTVMRAWWRLAVDWGEKRWLMVGKGERRGGAGVIGAAPTPHAKEILSDLSDRLFSPLDKMYKVVMAKNFYATCDEFQKVGEILEEVIEFMIANPKYHNSKKTKTKMKMQRDLLQTVGGVGSRWCPDCGGPRQAAVVEVMVDGFDQARVQLVVSRRVVIGCNWWWLRRRTTVMRAWWRLAVDWGEKRWLMVGKGERRGGAECKLSCELRATKSRSWFDREMGLKARNVLDYGLSWVLMAGPLDENLYLVARCELQDVLDVNNEKQFLTLSAWNEFDSKYSGCGQGSCLGNWKGG
ncbi:hypothetical protein Droror1_Dr00002839 [Drosera rotundifolia]